MYVISLNKVSKNQIFNAASRMQITQHFYESKICLGTSSARTTKKTAYGRVCYVGNRRPSLWSNAPPRYCCIATSTCVAGKGTVGTTNQYMQMEILSQHMEFELCKQACYCILQFHNQYFNSIKSILENAYYLYNTLIQTYSSI